MAVVRKQMSGKRSRYMLDYRYRGKRVRKTLGTDDPSIAEKVLQKVEAEMVLNIHMLKEEKERNISLSDFEKEYMLEREGIDLSPKTAAIYRSTLKRLAEHLGKSTILREVSRSMIEEYRSRMLKEWNLSPTTVNIEMRGLRTAWNWAKQDHKRYVEKNIFDKLKPIPVDEKVRRFMFDEEVARFFKILRDPSLKGNAKTCAFHLDRFVTFLLMVGSRRTETVNLRWKHVDFVNSRVCFEMTKTDKTRYIPMNAEVKTLLGKIKAERPNDGPNDRVFGYTDPESAGRAFRRFAFKAGLPEEITLHSTRHTAATSALRNGTDVIALKDFLGHSSLSTTMIYAKVVGATLVKVANALSVEGMIEAGSKIKEKEHVPGSTTGT